MQNDFLLVKIAFDAAENEPPKVFMKWGCPKQETPSCARHAETTGKPRSGPDEARLRWGGSTHKKRGASSHLRRAMISRSSCPQPPWSLKNHQFEYQLNPRAFCARADYCTEKCISSRDLFSIVNAAISKTKDISKRYTFQARCVM